MIPNPGDPAGVIRFNLCTVERTSPIKPMTQEAKSATSSRKKTPPPAAKPGRPARARQRGLSSRTTRPPYSLCSRENSKEPSPPLKRCCSAAPPEDRGALARCTSAPAAISSTKAGLAFLTPGERYDYAVSQINAGDFEEAANQLKGILADDPGADFAFYGLASSVFHHRQDAGLPRQPLPGHRAESQKPPSRRVPRQRLPEYGRRPTFPPSCCILNFRRRRCSPSGHLRPSRSSTKLAPPYSAPLSQALRRSKTPTTAYALRVVAIGGGTGLSTLLRVSGVTSPFPTGQPRFPATSPTSQPSSL